MATQGGGLCLMKITLLISSLFVCFPRLCLATKFTVGGSSGWDLTGAAGYQSWADSNTYHVGDTLAFSYTALHSVVETDAAGFQGCSTSNSILQDNSGSTVVPLRIAGKHYFICGTPGHCSGGMKFSVSVLNSSTQAANTTSNSPETPNAKPIIDSTGFATSTALPNAMLVGAGALGIPASILFLI